MKLPYEEFIVGVPGLLAIVDSKLECQAASALLRSLLGRNGPQPESHKLLDCLAQDSARQVREALDLVFETGESIANLEVRYGRSTPPKTGLLHAWRVADGADDSLVAVQIAPTPARDQTAAQLEELTNRSEMILNAVGDGIYGIDIRGCTTFVNRAAAKLLGWESTEILGKPLHDIHHHSHEDGTPYPAQECPIYAALRDGEVHRVENEVFWDTDGQAIPVEYTSTPIIKNGDISGAVVVFRDIRRRLDTERERAEAFSELQSIKHHLELILEAAGEGIYGIDREGRGTFANKAAIELLGWSLEDVVGKSVHEMHHHSHADGSPYPRDECPVYAALTDGEVHRVDNEVFWTKDGSMRHVDYTSTPIRSDNGKPDGAVVVFRDISLRKRIEDERDEAFARIRELNRQLELERDYLREEVDLTVNFGEIVGESTALKHTLAQVSAVAATPVSVLILGESGVGKEMIARAIHAASDRSNYPLIKVNCASVPKELFESEFFGHVKGAFTGAHRDRVGRMQLANGGTLFLDEVGEIPLSLQSKLLRALQESEFERVGDEETTSVDVRVVAATNRDLRAEVEAGRFREDLYYRLSVFPIAVPPLRERQDDILPLAVHFVNQFCDQLGREQLAISQQQAKLLQSQSWSGNIRELKNVMERAVILSKGRRLKLDLSSTESDGLSAIPDAVSTKQIANVGFVTESEFRELEKSNLIAALKQSDWRVSGPDGAAELLEIKPSTLAYRMKAFGIQAPQKSTPK